MSSQDHGWRSTRATHRGPRFEIDLNVVPPCESQDEEPVSNHSGSQDRQTGQEVGATGAEPIDVEALDDDVIIASATDFAVAKRNPRKKRKHTVVVDLESEEWSTQNKHRRAAAEQTDVNCDLYISVADSRNPARKGGQSASPAPVMLPKELIFSCPVCLGPFKEEVSTKCGHVFCKACIKASLAAQKRCPTCRRNITMKDTIRIYLPKSS